MAKTPQAIPAPLDAAPLAPPLAPQPQAPASSEVIPLRATQTKEFKTHRFKLDVAKARKNTSWQVGVMRIEDVEHVHFYNDKGRRGELLAHCNFVAGHTHAVTFTETKDGLTAIQCGPALVQSSKIAPGGRRNTNMEAATIGINPMTGTMELDQHTHPVIYSKTETFEITA